MIERSWESSTLPGLNKTPSFERGWGFFVFLDINCILPNMCSSLFDKPFYHGNVVFNFGRDPIDDLSAFASGYHDAGKLLVEKFEHCKGYADYEGYPIFFLYRHALELFLKAIAYRGAKLLNLMSDESIAEDPMLLSSHGLKRYIPLLKRICIERKWDIDDKADGGISLNEAFHFIEELEKVDPRSDTFRYPVTKSGKEALGHHTVLNVIHFGKTLDPVLELLDGMITGIEHHWDNVAEILFEVQEILKGNSNSQ